MGWGGVGLFPKWLVFLPTHSAWHLQDAKVPCSTYQQSPAEVDASLYGHIVGSLQKRPLQDKGQEEQDCQHIGVLQKFLR